MTLEFRLFGVALIHYLKNNNIFDQFCKNSVKQDNGTLFLGFMKKKHLNQWACIFALAFSWGESPEGYDFWLTHHKRFFHFFKQEYIDKCIKLKQITRK